MQDIPVVAFAMGDPSGISPELAARLLAGEAGRTAPMLVFGDRRVLEMGARHAGVTVDLPPLDLPALEGRALDGERPKATRFIDLQHCDPGTITIGEASAEGGASALACFRAALLAARAGFADLVFFTPFNKHAMRLAEADYVDEIGFIDRIIEAPRSGREFNVLDEVWNARVTSHIPLSEVASSLSVERVYDSLRLTVEVMQGAGFERPRLGVAALNPHAGDGGNFGTEDDEIIRPAVERAQALQLAVTGPVPSDTVFVRALRGEFDAVVTMYHDQGQIAIKLIGFDRGVTLIAGYPFPIVTPAHGTAYDIAGQGVAKSGAAEKALELGLALAARRRRGSGDAAPATGLASIVRRALAAKAAEHPA